MPLLFPVFSSSGRCSQTVTSFRAWVLAEQGSLVLGQSSLLPADDPGGVVRNRAGQSPSVASGSSSSCWALSSQDKCSPGRCLMSVMDTEGLILPCCQASCQAQPETSPLIHVPPPRPGTVLGIMFLSEGCLRGLQDEDCMWGGDGQGKTELPVGG